MLLVCQGSAWQISLTTTQKNHFTSRLSAVLRNASLPCAGFQLGVIAAVLFRVTSSPGLAQDVKTIVEGRREFLQYCAICHGKDGEGKGPMAKQLGIQPADLTHISKRNGGQFPFWHTYRVIDGREEVKEKGPRVMPVWGAEFQKEAGGNNPEAESLVRERILNLVYYVQSIQK